MPRGVSKPKSASQIFIPPAESIKDRWDQIKGLSGKLCCLCNEKPVSPESLVGLCRQCRDAGKLTKQRGTANMMPLARVNTATSPQEGTD